MLKIDQAQAAVTLQALESKIPLMFRFLGDEDDDVSGAVATFAQDYISLLKTFGQMTGKQRENIEALLYIVINKMKFDESYNFEQEVTLDSLPEKTNNQGLRPGLIQTSLCSHRRWLEA